MNNTYDCNSLDMVGSAKCGLSFAGLHEKSQKSCRPASNSTLQAYHQNPTIGFACIPDRSENPRRPRGVGARVQLSLSISTPRQ